MALAEVDVGCVGRKVTTHGLQVGDCEIASRALKVGGACIAASARVFQVLPSTQQNQFFFFNHLCRLHWTALQTKLAGTMKLDMPVVACAQPVFCCFLIVQKKAASRQVSSVNSNLRTYIKP